MRGRRAGRRARCSALGTVRSRIPESRWTLGQTWEHIFWAHWQVPTVDLRQRVPDELEIEEHDGSGWLEHRLLSRARAASPRRAAGAGDLGLPAAERPHVRPRPRRAARRLVLQHRRLEPARGARRAADLPRAGLPRADDARAGRRLAGGGVRAGRRAGPGVRRRATGRTGRRSTPSRARSSSSSPSATASSPRTRAPRCTTTAGCSARRRRRSSSPRSRRSSCGEPKCCHFAFRQDALIWPPEPIAS